MSSKSMFPTLSKARFSRQMARLNLISSGPGSVKVAEDVKSVELLFKVTMQHGHMGPRYVNYKIVLGMLLTTDRKFWRENLPRVQFHNTELPIQVTRVSAVTSEEGSKVPAYLKVTYKNGKSDQVDVKGKHSSEILKHFIQLTKATAAKEVIIDREPLNY